MADFYNSLKKRKRTYPAEGINAQGNDTAQDPAQAGMMNPPQNQMQNTAPGIMQNSYQNKTGNSLQNGVQGTLTGVDGSGIPDTDRSAVTAGEVNAAAGKLIDELMAADIIEAKIGEEEVRKASQILQRYKEGKANLERKIIENEQWWKLRHWQQMRQGSVEDPQPASAWLWNCIVSKHADMMDGYPEPNILPREEGDRETAKKLSAILPVVLEQNDFESVYSDVAWYKLKQGTGVYGVFWDVSKLNGLGDITIKKIDLLNLFWEPGITDIQKSRNVFSVELCDNELLEQKYPQLKGKLSGASVNVAKYIYDDSVDTSSKSVVVDWYYHTVTNGKKVLHYCKYVNSTVLFATENEILAPLDAAGSPIGEPLAKRGWYDHALYPFIFDCLFDIEGSPCGYGYTDICKDAQGQIDLMNQAILKNTLMAARPRFFIREDGGINEEEYADWTKDFVHVSGSISSESIAPIAINRLSSIYVSILNSKIDELKETSSNRDVNNGGTQSGVTAASAIAALQESSGKVSRDTLKTSYNAYKGIINQCIELVRQFYDVPRQFRIIGQSGEESFISYNNSNISPQMQGNDFNMELGYRLPVFDVEVSAQRANPYSKMSQNELCLQFYNLGFYRPENTDQALACLEGMDFNHKDAVIQKISQNGTLLKQLKTFQQIAMQLAQAYNPQLAQNLAAAISGGMPLNTAAGAGAVSSQAGQPIIRGGEDSRITQMRAGAQQASQPR